MEKIVHIIFFSLLAQIAFSQSVTGIVVDGITEIPIENVNIQLQFSNLGTTTNNKGEFTINIKSASANLIFTHINYEKHIEFIDADLQYITVKLYPSSIIIDEISISASSMVDTISNQKEYSVTAYELIQDYIFWIENHGLNKRKLSFKNLSSEIENSIWLKDIKNIEALEKSCNQRMHLVCKNFSYEILIINDKLIIGEKTTIQDYYEYIQPCVLRSGQNLYYQRTKYNGLQTSYVRYNIDEQSLNVFRTISETELINGYAADFNIIKNSEIVNNITVTTQDENTKVRDLQEKGDFLKEVFYKPVVSNFIYEVDQKIIILNHIENKIEFYESNNLEKAIDIKYNTTEKWLKHVILDQETKVVYTLFKSPKGIELRRISLQNGNSEFVCYLDTDFPNFETVKVHKDVAYFLGDKNVERSTKLLMSKPL